MIPGIYNISAEEYHDDPCRTPSLSSGVAKILLERPPLYAWLAHPRLNPNFQKKESKAAFDFGHAAHTVLLERGDGIEVLDFENYLTKAAKEARDTARDNNKTPILVKDFEIVEQMAYVATEALKKIGIDVTKTLNEQTIIANIDGVLCRTRPDIIGNGVIIDYKTTLRPLDQFARQASKFGYDLQATMYLRAAKELSMPCDWLFIAQETVAPYPVQMFKPTHDFMEIGRKKFYEALEIWRNCLKSDEWAGYDQEIQLLDAMPWDLNDMATEAEEKLLQEFDK